MRTASALLLAGVALIFLTEPLGAQEPAAPTTIEAEPQGPPVSPRGAFLRSLVLPGWGQAYVGAHGRGAVYFTMASGSLFMAYLANRQLDDARQQQAWLRDIGQIDEDEETEFVAARARHLEDWVALSLFMMFFSGADAYVAAYLADFDEHVGVRPDLEGGLRIEARVPLSRVR